MIECRRCEYYYKELEKDRVVGTCIRGVENPDDNKGVCMDFRELSEQDRLITELRLKTLRQTLKDMYKSARKGGEDRYHDDLMKEKF